LQLSEMRLAKPSVGFLGLPVTRVIRGPTGLEMVSQ